MSIRYLPFTRWWHWILTILLATSGLAVGAVSYLAKSPEESSCVSESSMDTAAAIIYCASTLVDLQDTSKLGRAMKLVDSIPPDNPLRPNADNLIQRWSEATMHLSQKAFHEGDLHKAVEIAEEIPDNHSSSQVVKEQIKDWQSIWSQAEGIYASALSQVEDNASKNWYTALNKAKQLQTLKNDYWANTKYYELVHHIQGARENKEKADKEQKSAFQKSETDTDISSASSTNDVRNDDDFGQLKKARALANSDKIDDMRAALVEASMVISESHREDARKLTTETEKKIAVLEDSTYLEEAKKLATKNDEISLKMAINEAKLIEKDRPLYKKANEYIARWDKQILSQSFQAVNPKKAPVVQKVSQKTVKNPKKPIQNKNQDTFDGQNEFKPILGDYNTKENFSIDKLEEMQINYSQ